MTASWLLQMGWTEVYVLDHATRAGALVQGGGAPTVLGLDGAKLDEIEAPALKGLLDAGAATVIDLATSLEYRDAHIPGAHFAVRSRLRDGLARIDAASPCSFALETVAVEHDDAHLSFTASVERCQGVCGGIATSCSSSVAGWSTTSATQTRTSLSRRTDHSPHR